MEDSLASARAARAEIRAGRLRGAAFREVLLAIPPGERDAWFDEVLEIHELPADAALPRGAVPYLPSEVDDVVAMVLEVALGPADELVDLGAGLGRVVILAHLLSGARARGIEIQEHLVDAARARAAALGLAIPFVHADASAIPLDGSVFFLYAPFNGEMLARALARLEEVARRRPIVVCAVGLELHVPWLAPRATASPSLVLYTPLPLPGAT